NPAKLLMKHGRHQRYLNPLPANRGDANDRKPCDSAGGRTPFASDGDRLDPPRDRRETVAGVVPEAPPAPLVTPTDPTTALVAHLATSIPALLAAGKL